MSFFKNRGLESDVRQASAATAGAEPAAGSVASVESLQGLESLRQTLAVLSDYKRNGAPFGFRWGLYVGNDLYPQAYKLYFARFKQLLLVRPKTRCSKRYAACLPHRVPSTGRTYDTLKAYLITTSNHDKSTRNFLSPGPVESLERRAQRGIRAPAARAEAVRVLRDELKIENPYTSENDGVAVERARRYLAQFAGFERVYQAMLADAAKTSPPINFNRQFPGSAECCPGRKGCRRAVL